MTGGILWSPYLAMDRGHGNTSHGLARYADAKATAAASLSVSPVSQNQPTGRPAQADIRMSGRTDERGDSFSTRVARMVLYTVKQDAIGLWSVRRMGMALFNDLKLAAAIELARATAHDEHTRSARPVSVEFHDVSSVIRLGSYVCEPARERVTAW